MGIHGITGELARYPRLGKIRKGGPKTTKTRADGREVEVVGRDLGERLRFASEDPDLEREWVAAFGSLTIEELTVLLPYATVGECWQAWREEYTASALKARCDGRQHVLWLDPKTGDYSDTPKPCPGASCQAKETGRLELLVLGFPRLGTVTLETHSLNDIANLDGCLRMLALQAGDLTQIPLRLCRIQRNISRPKIVDGKRTGERYRSPEWLLHIEPSPAWVQQRLAAQRQQIDRLITGTATMALPGTGNEDAIEADYRTPSAAEVEAHDASFTDRIAACTLVMDVEALLEQIAGIENEYRRQNATHLAYARIVELATPMIPEASAEKLAKISSKLDALPDSTPGLNQARDLVIARDQALKERALAGANAIHPQGALAGVQ
jgi:hypothetical protein